jgi:hypothetical protein
MAKIEGRAVIGDGAPFGAHRRGLGVQGWIQATESEPTRKASSLKQTRQAKESCGRTIALFRHEDLPLISSFGKTIHGLKFG